MGPELRNFKIHKNLQDQTVLFLLEGYLNEPGGMEVKRTFLELADKGYKKFILDFQRIGYINSIGISYLLDMVHTGRGKNLTFCFTSLSYFNQELFEIVGLTKKAAVLPRLEDALAYFSGPLSA